ncbi:MAG: PBP1A family penicillin-binding protein [Candidatus Roizmanbacteria bacterium]
MLELSSKLSTLRPKRLLLLSVIFFVRLLITLGETTRYIFVDPIVIVFKHFLAIGYLILYILSQSKNEGTRLSAGLSLFFRTLLVRFFSFIIIALSLIAHKIQDGYLSTSKLFKELHHRLIFVRNRIVSFRVLRPKSKVVVMQLPFKTSYTYQFLDIFKGAILRARLYIVVGLVLLVGVSVYGIYIFYVGLPSPTNIGKINYALTTHIYDRNDKPLYELYRDTNRTPIRLSNLNPHVAQATIAIEDKDFYHHFGISPIGGIARAVKDWIVKRQVQGGSTITQQLVKMSLLSSERTFTRKIKEAVVALQTEHMYTKSEILEMYLNQVPYGGSAYGIEEASRTYFGKHAADLSLAETALLAGLPQAPTAYSPFVHPDQAIVRRNQVLVAMYDQGYINASQLSGAQKEIPVFADNSTSILAPHFVFYAKQQVENDLSDIDLDKAGLQIQTSLDLDIQNRAQTILKEELEKVKNLDVSNGAILVTNPKTGEILAMVGSSGYFSGNDYSAFNVTTALRQPGSSFKPLLYAYALQRGYTSATMIDDSPVTYFTPEAYRPVNYDGRFHGRVTLRTALANSYNIPAVKLIDKVGVLNLINFARTLGIDTWEDTSRYGLSLSLGGGEVTMTDMAEAYSVLANQGKRTNLTPIKKVIDANNIDFGIPAPETEQIIDPAYAYIISDILSDNQARTNAFGVGSKLEIPGYKVSVKTGTTDSKKDNWTIGYTPDYLVVVWVGNNDGRPMNPYLTSGVTGAAPIWNRVMQYLLDEKGQKKKNWYERPSNIVMKTCYGKNETFISGTENSVPCSAPTPNAELVKKEDEHKNP